VWSGNREQGTGKTELIPTESWLRHASYQKSGVAETRYEFRCRDLPWKVSTRVLKSSKIIFIPQISNAKNQIGVL
jgi:hypothetical protein